MIICLLSGSIHVYSGSEPEIHNQRLPVTESQEDVLKRDAKHWLMFRFGVNGFDYDAVFNDATKLNELTKKLEDRYKIEKNNEDVEKLIAKILDETKINDKAFATLFTCYVRSLFYSIHFWLDNQETSYPFKNLMASDFPQADPFIPVVVATLSNDDILEIRRKFNDMNVFSERKYTVDELMHARNKNRPETLLRFKNENELRPEIYDYAFWLMRSIEMDVNSKAAVMGLDVLRKKVNTSFIELPRESHKDDIFNRLNAAEIMIPSDKAEIDIKHLNNDLISSIEKIWSLQLPTEKNNLCDVYEEVILDMNTWLIEFRNDENYDLRVDILYSYSLWNTIARYERLCQLAPEESKFYKEIKQISMDVFKNNGKYYTYGNFHGGTKENYLADIEFITRITEDHDKSYILPVRHISAWFTIEENIDTAVTGVYKIVPKKTNGWFLSQTEIDKMYERILENKEKLIRGAWNNMYMENSHDEDFLVWFLENGSEEHGLKNMARLRLQNIRNLYK